MRGVAASITRFLWTHDSALLHSSFYNNNGWTGNSPIQRDIDGIKILHSCRWPMCLRRVPTLKNLVGNVDGWTVFGCYFSSPADWNAHICRTTPPNPQISKPRRLMVLHGPQTQGKSFLTCDNATGILAGSFGDPNAVRPHVSGKTWCCALPRGENSRLVVNVTVRSILSKTGDGRLISSRCNLTV